MNAVDWDLFDLRSGALAYAVYTRFGAHYAKFPPLAHRPASPVPSFELLTDAERQSPMMADTRFYLGRMGVRDYAISYRRRYHPTDPVQSTIMVEWFGAYSPEARVIIDDFERFLAVWRRNRSVGAEAAVAAVVPQQPPQEELQRMVPDPIGVREVLAPPDLDADDYDGEAIEFDYFDFDAPLDDLIVEEAGHWNDPGNAPDVGYIERVRDVLDVVPLDAGDAAPPPIDPPNPQEPDNGEPQQ